MRRKSREKLCEIVLNYLLLGHLDFEEYLISNNMKFSYSCRRKGFVTIPNPWICSFFEYRHIHIPKDLAEKILLLGEMP